MTSIAQCLVDAGKTVRGSDVAEDFVTQKMLQHLQATAHVQIDPLTTALPPETEGVIYTAAHQGIDQPQVQQALQRGLAVFSQAEALAEFFNQQQGIAVCGVGGKTTVSAMITWILQQLQPQQLSYSVGVGEILGLPKTGQWQAAGRYFVAEADEYVINPNARQKGEAIIPRFHFLKPHLIVCNNLRFDHPDVYENFAHTQATFLQFFTNLQPNGLLLINGDDENLPTLASTLKMKRPDITLYTFGEKPENDFSLHQIRFVKGQSQAELTFGSEQCTLTLSIPGEFNLCNAAAALAACRQCGLSLTDASQALRSFRSTTRRFEFVKEKNGQKFFDDYAHHPSEVAATIHALQQSFPQQKRLIAFQPHTYSRTKQLLPDFVRAFGENLQADDQLVLLDIFASAREKNDPTVSSDLLLQQLMKSYPQCHAQNVKTLQGLNQVFTTADFSVALTMGAGDIYEVYQLF